MTIKLITLAFLLEQIFTGAWAMPLKSIQNIKNYVEKPDEEELELVEETPQPTPIEPEERRFERVQDKLKKYSASYGEHPQDEFLDKIKQIESSGGKDTDHKIMESGLHESQAAIGRWGLMPKTIKDMASNLNNPESLLAKAMGTGYQDDELQALAVMTDEEMKETIAKNPKLEKRLVRYMGSRLDRFEGDDVDKAVRWNMGTSLPKKEIDRRNLRDIDYVRKYLEEKEKRQK